MDEIEYAEELKELVRSNKITAAYHITGYSPGGTYRNIIILEAKNPEEISAEFSLQEGGGKIAGHDVSVVKGAGRMLSYAEREDLSIGLLKEWHPDRECYVMYVDGEI